MQKPTRPTGVTVLGVLQILGGVFGLLGGAGLLVAAAIVGSTSFASQYSGFSGYSTSTLSAIFYGFGAFLLILGILGLVIGIGFFSGKGWAWMLAIVVGVINIVANIVEIVIGLTSPSSGAIGIVIPIIIIYYLTRPRVKAFFGKGGAMPATPTPQSPSM
jgi:hypothetical protein